MLLKLQTKVNSLSWTQVIHRNWSTCWYF